MSPALLYKGKHFPGPIGDLEPPGLRSPSTLFCVLSSVSESLEGIINLSELKLHPALSDSVLQPLIHSICECLHTNGTNAYLSWCVRDLHQIFGLLSPALLNITLFFFF